MEIVTVSRAVGVRELKTRLGHYLREVRRGRRIVVTDRGEPVAELCPIAPGRSRPFSEIDRLVALGHLTRVSAGSLAPFRPIRRKGLRLSDAVVEGREDRF
jgi:prevent-host-death family protein